MGCVIIEKMRQKTERGTGDSKEGDDWRRRSVGEDGRLRESGELRESETTRTLRTDD